MIILPIKLPNHPSLSSPTLPYIHMLSLLISKGNPKNRNDHSFSICSFSLFLSTISLKSLNRLAVYSNTSAYLMPLPTISLKIIWNPTEMPLFSKQLQYSFLIFSIFGFFFGLRLYALSSFMRFIFAILFTKPIQRISNINNHNRLDLISSSRLPSPLSMKASLLDFSIISKGISSPNALSSELTKFLQGLVSSTLEIGNLSVGFSDLIPEVPLIRLTKKMIPRRINKVFNRFYPFFLGSSGYLVIFFWSSLFSRFSSLMVFLSSSFQSQSFWKCSFLRSLDIWADNLFFCFLISSLLSTEMTSMALVCSILASLLPLFLFLALSLFQISLVFHKVLLSWASPARFQSRSWRARATSSAMGVSAMSAFSLILSTMWAEESHPVLRLELSQHWAKDSSRKSSLKQSLKSESVQMPKNSPSNFSGLSISIFFYFLYSLQHQTPIYIQNQYSPKFDGLKQLKTIPGAFSPLPRHPYAHLDLLRALANLKGGARGKLDIGWPDRRFRKRRAMKPLQLDC